MRQVESFRLDREHRRLLERLARFWGVSRSEALRRILNVFKKGGMVYIPPRQ